MRPAAAASDRVHSFEHYDRSTGISVYTSPAVKKGYFLYFDPVDTLDEDNQARWANEAEHQPMVDAALAQARANMADAARASSIDTSDAEGPVH